MTDAERMTLIAQSMVTQIYTVTTVGGAWEKIADNDNQRFYIEFGDAGGSTRGPKPMPAPVQNVLTSNTDTDYPIAYKFHDCPSMVQGEWYVLTMLPQTFTVTVCRYKGK